MTLSNSHLVKLTRYFILKRFYYLNNKRDIARFLTFFVTVLITDAVQCGTFDATVKKNLRYSLFVKRIIAIEARLYTLISVRWAASGSLLKFPLYDFNDYDDNWGRF